MYHLILQEYGFEESFVSITIGYIDLMERNNDIDISQTPIEVQIISSVDWASHFIWPFMYIHRWENNHKNISDLQEDNRKKAIKDRTRKITIPEIKKFIEPKYKALLEQMWEMPECFIA